MAKFDLGYEELLQYTPSREEPGDFDRFWAETLAVAEPFPVRAEFFPLDCGLKVVDTFDVKFRGYAGQPIRGWFLIPKAPQPRARRLPCVVQFVGYGGGRGFPLDWLTWSAAGYANLVMDTRGQGSGWRNGDTPDQGGEEVDPHFPGFMTMGIRDPRRYYYRRLIVDAVRAVEAACEHPGVDPAHIAVTGQSQGGGLALIVSGLSLRVEAVMPDVPFLCNFRRAIEITDAMPYQEITRYCQVHRDGIEEVFRTLSYFDGLNFAVRAKARALFSVGLFDEICPPSTVFAAYNHYAGDKSIKVYPYNQHEGGDSYHTREQIRFLGDLWGTA